MTRAWSGVAAGPVTRPAPLIRTLLHEATAVLRRAGIATASLDARILLCHVLRFSAAELYLHLQDGVDRTTAAAFAALIARRRVHEPIAYLTGQREFFGLTLAVTPDVLIPRPETELLVERAIARLPPGCQVVDVGTGSGAIATAVASERADVRILAIDRSLAACRTARENSRTFQLANRVAIICGSLLSAVAGPIDAVLANLPYIRQAEIESLSPEVQREPRLALDGGADGLDLYRQLFAELEGRRPLPALVLCEIAPDQVPAMRRLAARRLPDHAIEVWLDLAGRARVVEASLRPNPG